MKCGGGCEDCVWEKRKGREVRVLDFVMVLREDWAVLTCAECGQMFFGEEELNEMVHYADKVRANQEQAFADKQVDKDVVCTMVMAAVQDAFCVNMKREEFEQLVRDVWRSREHYEATLIAKHAVGGVQ